MVVSADIAPTSELAEIASKKPHDHAKILLGVFEKNHRAAFGGKKLIAHREISLMSALRTGVGGWSGLWYSASDFRGSFRRGPMSANSSQSLTVLLRSWADGDESALDELTPLVYEKLHRLAHQHMAREQGGHTLQTTALINEVYLRLFDLQGIRWQDRAHFFALSAQIMRRILVDFARSRVSQKRGGGAFTMSLDEAPLICDEPSNSVVALDGALQALASVDERKSKVVELRFFGGLSVDETAEVLRVSSDTVLRDWKFAKSWLLRKIEQER